MKNDNKGFSLIELIVVIAIMAILIGALAPQYMKFVERSRKSTDVQNVAAIKSALEIYAADPMVATADQLGTGTIKITTTDTAVTGGSSGNASGNGDKALAAAGITTIGLKSNNWLDSSATDYQLTYTVSNGTVSFSEANLVDTDHSLLKGKYK